MYATPRMRYVTKTEDRHVNSYPPVYDNLNWTNSVLFGIYYLYSLANKMWTLSRARLTPANGNHYHITAITTTTTTSNASVIIVTINTADNYNNSNITSNTTDSTKTNNDNRTNDAVNTTTTITGAIIIIILIKTTCPNSATPCRIGVTRSPK